MNCTNIIIKMNIAAATIHPHGSRFSDLRVADSLFISSLKDDVDFRVTFKKIEITDQTTHHVVLRVILELDVISNLTGQIEATSHYMDKVILKRIPRSVNFPFGLEVVNFTETKL